MPAITVLFLEELRNVDLETFRVTSLPVTAATSSVPPDIPDTEVKELPALVIAKFNADPVVFEFRVKTALLVKLLKMYVTDPSRKCDRESTID